METPKFHKVAVTAGLAIALFSSFLGLVSSEWIQGPFYAQVYPNAGNPPGQMVPGRLGVGLFSACYAKFETDVSGARVGMVQTCTDIPSGLYTAYRGAQTLPDATPTWSGPDGYINTARAFAVIGFLLVLLVVIMRILNSYGVRIPMCGLSEHALTSLTCMVAGALFVGGCYAYSSSASAGFYMSITEAILDAADITIVPTDAGAGYNATYVAGLVLFMLSLYSAWLAAPAATGAADEASGPLFTGAAGSGDATTGGGYSTSGGGYDVSTTGYTMSGGDDSAGGAAGTASGGYHNVE